ncbi:MAG: hypothetical protein WCV67_20050 [Victivallaceae bacterium]|jgi:hypothetical protein
MTAKRRKKGSGYSVFVGFVVVPLLVINLFAIWKLSQVTGWADFPLFGSMLGGLAQLMIVLIVNSVAIAMLIMMKGS